MEVKIKTNNEMIDATIEMVGGVMIVSPKVEKFEPKDGDVCKSTFCIYIFKRVDNAKAVVYHCCLNVDQDELSVKQSIGVGYVDKYQRYATEEEKKLLFDKIDQEGYEWLADERKLIQKRWKPKNGDFFYFPLFSEGFDEFKVESKVFISGSLSSFDKGWHFKTEEECQNFCDKLNQAINSIKP